MPILQKPIMKLNHFLLALLFLNENCLTFIFLTNSNRFGLDYTKILDRLSDVTYELFSRNGSTVHVQRNHVIPYYPKEPLLYPHLCNFMRFSVSTQFNIPKPIKYANSDSSLLIPMNLNPTKIYHKTRLYHQLHLITILKLLTK